MTARLPLNREQLPNLPTRETYQMYGPGVTLEAARAAFERKYGVAPVFVGRVKPGDVAAGPVPVPSPHAKSGDAAGSIAHMSDAGSPTADPAESGDEGLPQQTAAADSSEEDARLL
ncbi:MAG: hypothetical protein IT317_13715 [Anaerolineales bacterium]|nr:hypothetical protein [Anaerolineales bacterium]